MKHVIHQRPGSEAWYRDFKKICGEFVDLFQKQSQQHQVEAVHLCLNEQFGSIFGSTQFNPQFEVDPIRNAADYLKDQLLNGHCAAFAMLHRGAEKRFGLACWQGDVVDWWPGDWSVDNEFVFEGCVPAE